MSSLNKKDTRPFVEKHLFLIFITSAVMLIAIVFLLAIAITPHSYYTAVGGL